MCTNCAVMAGAFASAITDPQTSYQPVLRQLDTMTAHGRMRMVYGDCPPAKAEEVLASEQPESLLHYFQCPMCRQYFKIAAYADGPPRYRLLDSVKDELSAGRRTMWDTLLELLDGTG